MRRKAVCANDAQQRVATRRRSARVWQAFLPSSECVAALRKKTQVEQTRESQFVRSKKAREGIIAKAVVLSFRETSFISSLLKICRCIATHDNFFTNTTFPAPVFTPQVFLPLFFFWFYGFFTLFLISQQLFPEQRQDCDTLFSEAPCDRDSASKSI